MVSAGDGVIEGKTSLMIGASRAQDVRVEKLPNGLTRSIPKPTSKGGRLAQHILLAHDDVGYRNGLSALQLNGEALVQAVSGLIFSLIKPFLLQHPREGLWTPENGWKQISEEDCTFHVVSSSRLKELEDEARASRAREEVRVVGTVGTTHLPFQVKQEEVTRMAGTDLSTTAQGFAQGLASGDNRSSTPNDASVIHTGTTGPAPPLGSTVVVDQTQPPPLSHETEPSSSSQTRPSNGQAAPSGPGASAPPRAPVQPSSSSQAQNPPGVRAGPTPTSQVLPFF